MKTNADASMQQNKRHITLDLIRKRSEHNHGLVSDLEEIALHQEELQAIGPVLARAAGKTLRILLLQNNTIGPRLHPADLRHFKRIEYLNLALNNVEVLSPSNSSSSSSSGCGIDSWEFLNKLDLTLNFIDLDDLKESVACLSGCRSLKELFMIGNPCMTAPESVGDDDDGGGGGGGNTPTSSASDTTSSSRKGWKYSRMYIVAKVPQLEYLDGTKISRSERIKANQSIAKLERVLDVLATKCKEERTRRMKKKRIMDNENNVDVETIGNEEEEVTTHCPEDRVRLGNELAQQKVEKERNERANQPNFKSEKDHEEKQKETIHRAREREQKYGADVDMKQCNEGRLHFEFDEEKRPGYLTLDIAIQKHLSSSLIDVDIHPTYICVVVKSKVLRLKLPTEVKSEASTAQRSTTTGHLLIAMPKCNPHCNYQYICASTGNETVPVQVMSKNISQKTNPKKSSSFEARSSLGVLQQNAQNEACKPLTGPVTLRGLVKECDGGVIQNDMQQRLDMVETSSYTLSGGKKSCGGSNESKERHVYADSQNSYHDDDDLPPPLI